MHSATLDKHFRQMHKYKCRAQGYKAVKKLKYF